jgi:hypothetical protein
MHSKIVGGQDCWRIAAGNLEAFVTKLGGHLGPVRFGNIQPYSVAPWAEERLDPATPPILRVLRGDFFCLPFGINATPWRGERHPVHGEPANATWNLESQHGGHLHLSLRTKVRPGRVDKLIWLRDAVYCRHVISGMSGPMSVGHHAMLRFQTPGVISTSRFVRGQVLPVPFELPEQRGYQALKPGATFASLGRVPLLSGGVTDLSRYPARRGFDDLAMLVSDDTLPLGWTAVTFPKERYVWFALKDPRVLRQTVLWISNGGRHYPPWNGRHVNVMGLEEVTGYFHLGLAESARRNPLAAAGHPTCLQLRADVPLTVNYIMAVSPIPAGFDRVATIRAEADGRAVRLRSASGQSIRVSLDVSFLQETGGG